MARNRSNQTQSTLDSATDPDRLMPDVRRSDRSMPAAEKQKDKVKDSKAEDLIEEKKEKADDSDSDFDCNICLEVSREPVITYCGHLFCWPCLYQWLHLHCDHNECPVCKGSVTESSVVPIYGRGSSEARADKTNGAEANQALKIPPRPQGNRTEGWRQQLLLNPLFRISEVLTEQSALVEDLYAVAELPERAQNRPTLEGRNTQVPPRDSPLHQATGTSSRVQGVVFQQLDSIQYTISRLPEVIDQLSSVMRATEQALEDLRNSNWGRREEGAGRAAAAVELPDSDPSLSQASTSSMVAVIRDDVAANDASLGPNRGGSSVNSRRRGRSGAINLSDANARVNSVRQRRAN